MTDGWKVSGFEPDLSIYDIEYDQPIEAVLRRCFEKYGSK